MSDDPRVLILKLDATGDVLRTTPLLRRLGGNITWVTTQANAALVEGLHPGLRCVPWAQRQVLRDADFDLVINLEDELEIAAFAQALRAGRRFGAILGPQGDLRYTDDAAGWFDMGLISRHGKAMADRLKFLNRRSYQSLIFEGLGHEFRSEPYLLPRHRSSTLHGDVAIAPRSGPVWPMKNWAHYDDLQRALQAHGLTVNVLPQRATLLEHVADVRNHRCLVSGDSLPMHVALGAGVRCVTLFTCTSPWEIHGYGLQTQLVSPRLQEFFYQRGFDPAATTAITLDEVLQATLAAVQGLAARSALQ
jgi:heptosyltransferase-2